MGRGEIRAPLKRLRGRLDTQWCKIFFQPGISLKISLRDIFFLKSNTPPPPLKSQMVGPFQSYFGLLHPRYYSRFREQTTPVFRRPQTSVFNFFFHLVSSRFVKKLCMPMVVEIDRLCSLGTVTALINNVTENTRQQSKRGSCV